MNIKSDYLRTHLEAMQSVHLCLLSVNRPSTYYTSSRGFRGASGAHPPPTAQNFLDFMQFFGKFDKIICWRPPPPEGRHPLLQGILDPPLTSTIDFMTLNPLQLELLMKNVNLEFEDPHAELELFKSENLKTSLSISNWTTLCIGRLRSYHAM